MEIPILIFKIVNLTTKSAKNSLSKVQNLFMKVQLSNSKSEKSGFKSGKMKGESTLLEPNIDAFETRFYTLERFFLVYLGWFLEMNKSKFNQIGVGVKHSP